MKKKQNKWIILSVLLLFCIAAAGALAVKPDWRFRCAEKFRRLTMHAEMKETDNSKLKLVSINMDDIENDNRFTLDQSLLLINQKHIIGNDFHSDLEEYKDSSVLMNRCISEAYEALAEDVKERFGEKLYIKSAYRTAQEQSLEYQEAAETAATVGSSEHQAGLALDVCVKNYGGMAFLKTPAGQYVNRECSKYGFIIRYPDGKEASTGFEFEPWHIRYVGIPHAEIIYRNSWTLEEYYDHLEPGKFYTYDGYYISRQPEGSIQIPSGCRDVSISPDNQGNYVLTIPISSD